MEINGRASEKNMHLFMLEIQHTHREDSKLVLPWLRAEISGRGKELLSFR